LNEVLAQLIEFLKLASPLVWQTLVKQVYSNAVACLIWAIALLVLCVVLVKFAGFAWKQYKEHEYSMWDVGTVFLYIGSSVSCLIAFGLLVYSIQLFINPEFYAIQYIVSQISGH
jgi:hypothetical protein